MKTVSLPFFDHDGTLTPALLPYLEAKLATADRDPADEAKIVVTFSKAKDANDFLKAISADADDAHDEVAPEAEQDTTSDA